MVEARNPHGSLVRHLTFPIYDEIALVNKHGNDRLDGSHVTLPERKSL